jgi:hypothetical protein
VSPVADEPDQFVEQVSPGLTPAEQGHLGTSAQRVRHDGAAHERRAAENKDPHVTDTTGGQVRSGVRRHDKGRVSAAQ